MNTNFDLVKEGESILKNFDEFGKLLDTNWKLKKKLHHEVTNTKLDRFYNNAIQNGALGGKLLGAGAGGFFLFYFLKNKKKNFIKNKKNQFTSKFKFEKLGTTIINNSK